jgi:hypothetical protein
MVEIIASWRCKCGTRVKVIAEADSTAASATKIASCPSCGHRHPIHADKIISVMEDIAEVSPAAVSCAEKDPLLVAQNNAFNIYTHEASELAEAVGRMAHADFAFLANRVSAARQFWLETRQRLNQHTAQHGC